MRAVIARRQKASIDKLGADPRKRRTSLPGSR
jgi:hypothetical protein